MLSLAGLSLGVPSPSTGGTAPQVVDVDSSLAEADWLDIDDKDVSHCPKPLDGPTPVVQSIRGWCRAVLHAIRTESTLITSHQVNCHLPYFPPSSPLPLQGCGQGPGGLWLCTHGQAAGLRPRGPRGSGSARPACAEAVRDHGAVGLAGRGGSREVRTLLGENLSPDSHKKSGNTLDDLHTIEGRSHLRSYLLGALCSFRHLSLPSGYGLPSPKPASPSCTPRASPGTAPPSRRGTRSSWPRRGPPGWRHSRSSGTTGGLRAWSLQGESRAPL